MPDIGCYSRIPNSYEGKSEFCDLCVLHRVNSLELVHCTTLIKMKAWGAIINCPKFGQIQWPFAKVYGRETEKFVDYSEVSNRWGWDFFLES